MLEGIVDYYNGDNAAAIEILDNVVEREPKNTTARAMLALSYGHHGDWNRYSREILQVQRAPKATHRKDHESLILGCALMYSDTARCIEMLQETVGRHPEWAVARAMLGGALAHRAVELPDPQLVNRALEETRLAQRLLPENVFGTRLSQLDA